MRILTVLGTRPEIVKLAPVLCALHSCEGVESRLCHTGQHDRLGFELLDTLDVVPQHRLSRPADVALPELFASLSSGIGKVLAEERPDCVVVQGDTASAAAGALAAFHCRIPVAHVEAGLRSGDLSQPWPEEGYRRLIAPLSHWHFAPTPAAVANLKAEGIASETIHLTGNTAIDALRLAQDMLRRKPALGSAADAVLARVGNRRFALATVHRREHSAEALGEIGAALAALADEIAIVLPLHPRPQSRPLADAVAAHPAIHIVPPLDYFAFVRLLDAARLVLTDSGGIQEEAVALGKQLVVLRDVTERAEAVATGHARLAGHDCTAILAAARDVLNGEAAPPPADVFGDGMAAQRIARILTG